MWLRLFRSYGVTNQMKPLRHLENSITRFFSWRSLRSHAPSLANPIFVGRKKQKQRQKKCLWIGCRLTPVKRLWQTNPSRDGQNGKGGPLQYRSRANSGIFMSLAIFQNSTFRLDVANWMDTFLDYVTLIVMLQTFLSADLITLFFKENLVTIFVTSWCSQ